MIRPLPPGADGESALLLLVPPLLALLAGLLAALVLIVDDRRSPRVEVDSKPEKPVGDTTNWSL